MVVCLIRGTTLCEIEPWTARIRAPEGGGGAAGMCDRPHPSIDSIFELQRGPASPKPDRETIRSSLGVLGVGLQRVLRRR